MALIRNIFRYRKARKVTTSMLAASASTPLPPSASADNSQAASAAIVELAHHLDEAIDEFCLGGETSDQVQAQLDRLREEAERYSNAQICSNTDTNWTCTPREAQIIAACNACAAAVYQPKGKPQLPGMIFNELKYSKQSTIGAAKAIGMWSVDESSDGPASESFIIIAIKGTANMLDIAVNLNGRKKSAASLIPKHLLGPASQHEFDTQGHAGFIHAATALLLDVYQYLHDVLSKQTRIKHVVFTGHSAGGAVASLLFARCKSSTASIYSNITFSLVTFGAPPTIDVDLTPHLKSMNTLRDQRGLMLSFANEYDLVTRVDRSYLISLIELFHSINQKASTNRHTQETEVNNSNAVSEEQKEHGMQKSLTWPLPKPEYYPIGDVVVLKVTAKNENAAADNRPATCPEIELSAIQVSPDSWSQLLFCGTRVHSRVWYTERIGMILNGRFNGADCWENHGQALST